MTSYDAVHYPEMSHRQTRLDSLELLGRLLGLEPPPAGAARVLEIGCATGGNLLSLAELFPGSDFVGIDIARTQIAVAAETARAAGAENVELVALDLCDVDERFGEFDYIIAHGVYSWVPAPVQGKLLDLVARRLTPGGIAYISHNVKPGWYQRAAAGGMMRYHTQHLEEPGERVEQARALLQFLAGGARREGLYREMLEEQLELTAELPDELLLFDYLADENEGCFFRELEGELGARGLRFLCDADASKIVPVDFAREVVAVLGQLPDGQREQLYDFLTNRSFRHTLVVREGEAAIDRSLPPERLMGWHVGARAALVDPGADLDGAAPVVFRGPRGMVRVPTPATKRALVRLSQQWPASLPFAELDAGGDAGKLARDLLQLFVRDVVELNLEPDRFMVAAPERPRVAPLARLGASRGFAVTNRRHERVLLNEEGRRIVPLLDGSRDRAALAAALSMEVEALDALLVDVGRMALFLPE